ncbi:hypothetical protein AAG570_010743 [Ranatra chinensis]|uniref:Uncharacterized protein n=1 Tax=Ranatra chinensis TaxID=642074 RepID=A0ABD0YNG9_9HEMI
MNRSSYVAEVAAIKPKWLQGLANMFYMAPPEETMYEHVEDVPHFYRQVLEGTDSDPNDRTKNPFSTVKQVVKVSTPVNRGTELFRFQLFLSLAVGSAEVGDQPEPVRTNELRARDDRPP